MKQIKIEGFTTDTKPNMRPAVCVYGEENVGTTRFGCTAPHDKGWIGWLALDKNSKATVEEYKQRLDLPILINAEPFISPKESIEVALQTDPEKVKTIYTGVVNKIFKSATLLASNPDVQSIVIDRASQLFDYILFSHFGRRNQIETFQRGAPNQDMIDLITALGTKNLVLVHKATEIWKDTGEVDPRGRKKQGPTGKYKPDGFNQVSRFVTATIELTAKRTKVGTLEEKYKCRIITCKGRTLLEGGDLSEYAVEGEGITWDGLMNCMGIDDE